MNYKYTNSINKLLFLCVAFISIVSCKDDVQIPTEIREIPIDLVIKRFDLEFADATVDDLPELKNRYPYFFAERFPDTYWAERFTDTIQQEINTEVAKAFSEFTEESAAIEHLFRHIKYYFPKATIPEIITITSNVDYKNKVILADSLLLISLDTYLGEEHHFYTGIPAFQRKNFRRAQIDVDVAYAFAKAKTPKPRTNDFLAQMIYEGKKLFLVKKLLSMKEAHEIFGFTEGELSFAQENEINIWEFFIKNELLYSTDKKLLSRFIDPAPFSKFYLSFDNETPGRIGRYIGYKIVRSYVENNDVAIKNLLNQDAETIFANAKYKP